MAVAMQSVQNVSRVRTVRRSVLSEGSLGKGSKELQSTATTTYGTYITNVGLQGDTVKLNVTLAAYLLEYGKVGP